jgi:cell division protein FtsA
MPREDIIVGLDLGSSMVRVAVGQVGEDGKPKIIGIGEAPSNGIRKGSIVDVEDAVSSISQALEKAERMTGVPIEHAFIAIGGSNISTNMAKGVVAVSRADGEISADDVARAIEAAQASLGPSNQEILHIIPKNFSVDSQTGIKDPVGMNGIRLEVNAHIIQGSTHHLNNITKVVYRAGIDIDDFVLSPLASASSVLSKRQKELGVVLADIGGGTTDVAVFEEGELLYTNILSLGASHITNDLAIGLKTSIDVAERVKLEFGYAMPSEVEDDEEIDLSKIDEQEEQTVSRREVAEIIHARLEEIFEMIEKELKRIKRDGKLPGGVVLSGGGAKLPGVVDVAKEALALPAQIGFPKDYASAVEKVDDPAFATAVGLVVWGSDSQTRVGKSGFKGFSQVTNTIKNMRKWFKSFLP